MKKVLLPILFLLMALTAISQNLVQITGTVTDLNSGAPISNQAVTISNDSSGGWIYYQTVYTNISGFYADTVPVPLNTQGTLFVRTIDCQNLMHQAVLTFTPSMLVFTADFAICYNSSPCQANFTTQQSQPLVVQYTDASLGGGTTRLWDFGDGATSTDLNPMHTYSFPGYYLVSLTIGALGTTCYNTTTQNVYVSDSIGGGGCQASFYVVPDSMNTTNTYQFFDQSWGNINSWAWDFGDPASGVNNFSMLQNPTHTYSQPGTYNACLTIHGIDSTCYDMTCLTIAVGTGGGCNAEFSYYNDTVNSTPTIHFNDLSTAGMGYINKWTWDFGDGQTLTVEYPMNPNVEHTYAQPGTYNVCLSIFANDSTCYDMTCHPVSTIANSECDAQFVHSIPASTAYPTSFTDMSTAGGGLPITSWYWNFGDPASGASNTSTLQNPTHLFTAQGTFIVCLTIQGADSSCYDMTCQTIIVEGGAGCQANFSYSTNPVSGNNTVIFMDLSSGGPTSWQWSFGDGTAGTAQNPVHTYAGPGSYNVCLTITGNNCTSTFCQVVVVQDSVVYHQVYGQVFAGNFPISLGMAMIFSLDTGSNYTPYFAVCPIDSNGVYYFTTVPDGNYYIMAIPFDSNGYMPTYYGNTINWEDATLVSLGTPNNPYNINCVAYTPMMPGPGSTSGQINTGDVITSMVDKINMMVMNEQGTPVGFTHVSTSGAFSFPSMAYGTYYLHAEMPGVTSDNVKIILSPEKPHADVVMTFSGNSILGIRDEVTLVNRWSAYPNPVIDNLNVSIDMKQGMHAEAGIYNLTGQKVAGMQVTLQAGNNYIVLPTASLPIGIYTLRIQSQEGVILTTKLVRTK